MKVVLLPVILLAGCDSASAVGDRPVAHDEHNTIVRLHMRENYGLQRSIERLLVRGQLEQARELARAMAMPTEDSGLGLLARHAVIVRERAAALAASPGLDEACRRQARLAEACASCHVEANVTPLFARTPNPPPDEPTLQARMARHSWAADRVWEGMVGGAEEPWRAGFAVLAEPPLPWSELSGTRQGLAQHMQQLSTQARGLRTSDLRERARMYGEILVTCAACHGVESPVEPVR